MNDSQIGRPRASSREVLAEAACELFLEQGYDATSVADITRRAGVSRSSFFNYFGSKGDVLWAALDERITAFVDELREGGGADAADAVRSAVQRLGAGFAPDSLALAIAHAAAMGLEDELEREASLRRSRIGRAVAERLRAGGADAVTAQVAGAATGGAVLAAIEAWATDGAGHSSLADRLNQAMDAVAPTLARPRTVRQLRVVVRVEDIDTALAFYRDALGLEPQEAYQGDDGARVAILGAGRATLELANPAQVALIDGVETDGDAPSDPIRVGFEVGDTVAMLGALSDAGARVEASARLTPWRSLNARLRGPAGLQVTLFQELGPE
ncbi:TetR family transcriptional regulator [Microbacterium sp. CJ88]|uniref:TetR family transcriptional regulator n=1 Tax=Microbacterium sp. CJ88 TaxID=3445672 RepID=UPI003F65DF95